MDLIRKVDKSRQKQIREKLVVLGTDLEVFWNSVVAWVLGYDQAHLQEYGIDPSLTPNQVELGNILAGWEKDLGYSSEYHLQSLVLKRQKALEVGVRSVETPEKVLPLLAMSFHQRLSDLDTLTERLFDGEKNGETWQKDSLLLLKADLLAYKDQSVYLLDHVTANLSEKVLAWLNNVYLWIIKRLAQVEQLIEVAEFDSQGSDNSRAVSENQFLNMRDQEEDLDSRILRELADLSIKSNEFREQEEILTKILISRLSLKRSRLEDSVEKEMYFWVKQISSALVRSNVEAVYLRLKELQQLAFENNFDAERFKSLVNQVEKELLSIKNNDAKV